MPATRTTENAEHERDERPGDRDPELGAGARKAALELRHAAEEPEIDALDLHPVSPRLQSVSELVQEERCEEEESGDDGQHDVLTVREAGVLRREDGDRERPDDEREDDQPAPVDPDPDAGDPAELKGRIHEETLRVGASGADQSARSDATTAKATAVTGTAR